MATTIAALKARNELRVEEEKKILNRKRALLVLIFGHLKKEGYLETTDILESRAGFSFSDFDIADNVDLYSILHDYEQYFEKRFNREPILVKRVSASKKQERRQSRNNNRRSSSNAGKSTTQKSSTNNGGNDSKRNVGTIDTKPKSSKEKSEGGLTVTGNAVGSKGNTSSSYFVERLLKPLGGFGVDKETKELASIISRDIYQHDPGVRWDDIVGLLGAKRLVQEAVVMPIKYPQLFDGVLEPWRGILLYGPPGTGKTMLARAVASECKTTFFNISASSIVSKWRGDSEKLVRVLFDLARYHAPSTIFLDELDSIMSRRGGGRGDHEASRRMKTEILVQMDGLQKSQQLVFVLCASNLPWELDSAMLRRLEKRILVPLPDEEVRKTLFQRNLPSRKSKIQNANNESAAPTFSNVFGKELDYETYAKQTEGYSGSDIKLVCKEAAMRPMRRLIDELEGGSLLSNVRGDTTRTSNGGQIQMDPVVHDDVAAALECVQPSSSHAPALYTKWEEEFGSSTKSYS
eukprot:g1087.t1